METRTSPELTVSPLFTLMEATVPSCGATISFSIFMASRMTSTSPALTEAPAATLTSRMLQPAPHCPPQSQASGPAGGQIPDGQQQTMWPPQQPAQRPAPHQAPPQPQYAGQRPMSRQLPPQPAYAEQQISYRQEQEQNPEDLYPYYQRGQEVPTYRPEDYEEYPDFPQSMLEPNVSHYQSI